MISAESIINQGHCSSSLVICDWKDRTMAYEKVEKGAWRMPWLSQAMKDVISCDKLWVGANDH